MYDIIIDNARIVDGTGRPSFHGSVAVKDGLIAAVGKSTGEAAHKKINADGLVLSPGFIDPHTHYDAQVAWDPLLTCTSWHGITSVVMGNCGVGVAPVRPKSRDIVMWDLVNVEAIPYEVMEKGIDWQWESHAEYLAALQKRGLGINVASLAALTPIRHYAIGEESFERAATADEIADMQRLFRDAMQAGAFGLTTTVLNNHIGFEGRPLACRNASRDELSAIVKRELATLPPAQREILILREFLELSYAEIGNVLGVPAGTVMSRLHRARSNLADRVKPYG